jgi:hypothetical protein
MTLLELMSDIQKATKKQPKEKMEKLFTHGCDNEAQCWGLADCLIASAAMFNHDRYMASQYLHYVYMPINEGIFTEEEVASHIEGRLRDLRITIR